ncbi:MAG: hypothetical protein DRJ65_07285, partial [Acidobacteria bacterium]
HYAVHLGEDPTAIYFDINSPYREKEIAAIESLEIPVAIKKVDLIMPEDRITPTEQIIRGRNFILAALGAYFGNEVWLGALYGEIHNHMPDKSNKFKDDFNAIAEYVYHAYAARLVYPFEHMTKTEVVSWALENGITPERLMRTNTCYDPVEQRCGRCSTCFKRWTAMINNGIEEEYPIEPHESEAAQSLLSAYQSAIGENDFSHYGKKRIEETKTALGKIGIKGVL